MKGLEKKTVLITGGTSGIGRAIAQRFAEEGAQVVINYRKNKDEALSVLSEINASAPILSPAGKNLIVQADVSKRDEVETMFGAIAEQTHGLDVLINNAGIQIEGPSHEIEIEDFNKVLDVNLRGAYLCARYAIRHFLAEPKPGVIINNSSVHEIIPRPGYLSYTMSKGAMQNMTQTLALEYARQQIRVNAIAPGATLTPINPWAQDPEKRAEIEDFIPLGRAGTSAEMAAAAAFLASDEAAYITGQTLFIDGGLTLFPGFRNPIT